MISMTLVKRKSNSRKWFMLNCLTQSCFVNICDIEVQENIWDAVLMYEKHLGHCFNGLMYGKHLRHCFNVWETFGTLF
jgi:hypothetical protein